jgi:hypothetical protein
VAGFFEKVQPSKSSSLAFSEDERREFEDVWLVRALCPITVSSQYNVLSNLNGSPKNAAMKIFDLPIVM